MAAAKKGKPAHMFAPDFALEPAPHLVNDGKANTQANQPGTIDERRKAMMAYLKPAWS
jgi:hypothetical protein